MATEIKEKVEVKQDSKPEVTEKRLFHFLNNDKLFDMELENPDTSGKTK